MSKPILAAAGILFVLFVVAAIIYFIVRLLRTDKDKDRALAEHAGPEDPISALRARYDERFIMLEVPHNAMIVRVTCNNYSSQSAALRHYCWVRDGMFMMFPLWDSLMGACASHVVSDMQPREWRIPVADIVCFAAEQGLPNKFVVLQYRKDDDILTLAFSEDANRVFALLFPEKDFSHLLEELYPKSSRNIRDIKENFLSLKELRGDDLITEEEYVAKKKEMLILM